MKISKRSNTVLLPFLRAGTPLRLEEEDKTSNRCGVPRTSNQRLGSLKARPQVQPGSLVSPLSATYQNLAQA